MEGRKRKRLQAGSQSSKELSKSYFQTLKTTSRKAWDLYYELGNGNVYSGYDISREFKIDVTSKLRDYYYMIKDSKYTFVGISEIVFNSNKDIFSSKNMVVTQIWQKIWRTDSFVSYRSHHQLKAVIGILDEMLDAGKIKELKEY